MFLQPESMMLSEVLQDIGVTENMVKKIRRQWMINESLMNIESFLNDYPSKMLILGSQTEASTTYKSNSDIDILYYQPDIQVIEDMSQRRNDGKLIQYLMIQDETTSPGYCKLQLLGDRYPYHFPESYHTTNSTGQILLTNTCICSESVKHGPSHHPLINNLPCREFDYVYAIHCPFWPEEAKTWLNQQNESGWPTEEMKHYSVKQGCFVVPVASERGKRGNNKNLEWRISTCLAERCMMYNLNITQIRCYILMKMIIKTRLKPKFEETISSFMCKNILFRCIAASAGSSAWNEGSLLTWLNQCLQNLLNCILTENCPYFVIPGNNLLDGKLSADVKGQLAGVMTENIYESLYSINIEDLGKRLLEKTSGISADCFCTPFKALYTNVDFTTGILKRSINTIHETVFQDVDLSISDLRLKQYFSKLCQVYLKGTHIDKASINLIIPFLCTIKGSVTASADIYRSHKISSEALSWFNLGLNSDLFSGRLKLASALYCAGNLEKCEQTLADLTEKVSETTVATYCICNGVSIASWQFWKDCYENNYDVIKKKMAFCVRFSPNEVNCIPRELKHEMFHSKESQQRVKTAVDSISYLYFLQYKMYKKFNREADKIRALKNLDRTIKTSQSPFHKQTALNLLGQCMEQENRQQDALHCYMESLKIQPKCNVAKCRVNRMNVRFVRRLREQQEEAKAMLLAGLKALFSAACLITLELYRMYLKE